MAGRAAERIRIGARHGLVGQLSDYQGDPVGVLMHGLEGLLRQYAAAGGDLEDVQLTIGTEKITPGRLSREHTVFRLDGYRAQ